VNWFRLAQPIVLAWGWRRASIALAAGAVSTLALAPVYAWPVMFVTFPVLVWLIDGAGTTRRGGIGAAFAIGWCFGFGYFLTGLYWIGYAFLVDAKTFGWLLPFAVTALPAGLAVFTGLGVAFARLLWSPGASRILTLAAALSAAEWLRGHVLTGFPWNTYGYALTAPLPLAQGMALVGVWGFTFIAIAVFASPAALADQAKRPWLPVACAVAMLAVLAGYGTTRLALNPTEVVEGVRLRIMQPNLSQDEKFNYAARHDIMSRYVALSERSDVAGIGAGARPGADAAASALGGQLANGRTPNGQVANGEVADGAGANGLAGVTHVIWPESAFPFFLTREPDALAAIAGMLPPGSILITGAASLAAAVPGRGPRAYNSVYVIDHAGTILSSYDKLHLVPFGEFLPFQDTLERLGFTQLTKVQGGFLAGDRRRKIALPDAPDVLVLVCYEIIFPGEVVPQGERPGWLLNVTNDAWFGISAGPYQHFQQARVRAIEEGLPLVRAANDGISAVIDPLGRIIGSLPLAREGVLDATLPQAAAAATIYARIGDIMFFIVVGATILAVSGLRLQK
jgi:apolipoprotein N-acyltransferase